MRIYNQKRCDKTRLGLSQHVVEVSMTLKKPKANWGIQGETMSIFAHSHGNLNVHRSVTVCFSGTPLFSILAISKILHQLFLN